MENRSSAVLAIAALLLAFAAGPALSEDLYKWRDAEGKLHISNTPPPYTNSAPKGYEKWDAPVSAAAPLSPAGGGAAAAAAKENQVEVYGTSWCPACVKVRQYLHSKGIPFRDYDVDTDPSARARWAGMAPSRSVPLVVVNGQRMLGFDSAWIQSALRSR